MKNHYVVAIASLFTGINKIYKVCEENPRDAKLKALILDGWDVKDGLEATLGQIDSLVSEPLEIN